MLHHTHAATTLPTQPLLPPPTTTSIHSSELESLKDQLSAALSGNSGEAAAARAACEAAEAARAAAEERWRLAYEELLRTKLDLESAQ